MNIADVKGNNNNVAMGDLVINRGGFSNNIDELLLQRERMFFRYQRFMSECDAIEAKYNQDLTRYLPFTLIVLGLLIGFASLQNWLPAVGLFISIGLIMVVAIGNKQPSIAKQQFIQEVNYYVTLANQQAEQIRTIDLDIEFIESRESNFEEMRNKIKKTH